MRVTVQRLKDKSNDKETVSKVYVDDEFLCYGIEQPWADNTPFSSCVPDGAYNFVNFKSKKYGDTYALYNPQLGVTLAPSDAQYLGSNRYACLVHSANYARQLQGCLALGKDLLEQADCHMVTSSRDTVNEFLDILNKTKEPIMVEIVWS